MWIPGKQVENFKESFVKLQKAGELMFSANESFTDVNSEIRSHPENIEGLILHYSVQSASTESESN